MELLPDPTGDRKVPTLDPPPNKPLSDKILYPYKGMPLAYTSLFRTIVANMPLIGNESYMI